MTVLLLVPTQFERDALGDFPAESRGALTVEVCGMGLVAAALGAEHFLRRHAPSHCILAGLAGSRDLVRAPIGSLVIGTCVHNEGLGAGHGRDFGSLSDMAPPGEQMAPDTWPLEVPTAWLGAMPQPATAAFGEGSLLAGEIGTVAASSNKVSESDDWSGRRPSVLVEEMEGYAVAVACGRAGVPLSIVRGVSNRAGVRDKGEWKVSSALSLTGRFLRRVTELAP